MTIADLVKETKSLKAAFRRLEQRPWSIEANAIELLAEAGTLADYIMIKEGYRPARPGQKLDLDDAVADVVFVLVSIAEHYGIDVDRAYRSMIRTSRTRLKAKSREQRPVAGSGSRKNRQMPVVAGRRRGRS